MSCQLSTDFMRRAITEAKKGEGFTHPNPLVGALLVKDEKEIASGYHHRYGDLHAERDCLKNALDKGVSIEGATLYVTLEPCCHTGKQPPCTEAIIKAGIKKVVVGSRDPNPLVSGKGVQRLKEAGIEVVQDFLKEECDSLNAIFFHYITKKMPYVIVKYAMTADGRTATVEGKSKWITGEKARENVHKTRSLVAAVMTGIGTVIKDNPLLTCRLQDSKAHNQGVRVVCDTNLRLSAKSALASSVSEGRVICVCKEELDAEGRANRAALESIGVEIRQCKTLENHLDIKAVLDMLVEEKIDSVLVESGGNLAASVLPFAQEVQVYIAPKIFGGISDIRVPIRGEGVKKVEDALQFSAPEIAVFGSDVLLTYKL